MNPGDKFAFIFVPNGKIEQVFKNPNRGGSKSPLYSLATENPEDEFPQEKFVDVTGESRVFAFEDIKVDRKREDRDYNDLIFSISGATGAATSINDVVNPKKDWRELANGQEFLELAESLIEDSEAPEISVELARDTGADNTDRITTDSTVTGTVTDEEEIISLRVGFNNISTEEYAEIIDLVDADGNFNLDPTKLTEILGKTLAAKK